MRRTILCVIAAAVLGALLPAPAQATSSLCPDFQVCLWDVTDFQGQRIDTSDERGVSNKIRRLMNNQASAADNSTLYAALIYSRPNGQGRSVCLNPSTNIPDLSTVGMDNTVSSTRVTRRALCP